MSKHRILKRSLAVSAGLAALTFAGAGAQAAQASGSTGSSGTSATAATASSTTYLLPGYGSSGLMPTWVWGGTTLCAFNVGYSYGTLKVQSTTGAAPEYIGVGPYQQNCINRWWWGVPVRTTNVSNSPLLVSGS
jgi:hypothetical protein